MFLAFQTCENANYNLSRATVFGGPFDDHSPLGGYFDV
jgi:hypothetical protein